MSNSNAADRKFPKIESHFLYNFTGLISILTRYDIMRDFAEKSDFKYKDIVSFG